MRGSRSMLTCRTEIRVRYAETDMMSVAYHGSYLPWLEIGRTELMRENGLPYAELERAGYRLPVIEVGLNYKRPALYDDVVTIVTSLREKPILRIRMEYELFKGETLLATGHTVHAVLNHKNEVVRPPASLVAAIRRWFADTPA